MQTFKKVLLIIAIILTILGIGYVVYGFYKKTTVNIPNPIVTMEIEDYGTVKFELYPDKAPNTVANFIRLVNRGFYNNSTFHRTIPDFMIQGGSKNGDQTVELKLSDIIDNVSEDTEYAIEGEFIANGYEKNTIKHNKGVVSMARADYTQLGSSFVQYGYNSASSQFFIMTEDNTSLDGLYAAFGQVIEGMDVVEKIGNTEVYYRSSELKNGEEAPKDKDGNTIDSDKPKKEPIIKRVTVETYGADYGIPKTVKPFDYYNWLMQQYGNNVLY